MHLKMAKFCKGRHVIFFALCRERVLSEVSNLEFRFSAKIHKRKSNHSFGFNWGLLNDTCLARAVVRLQYDFRLVAAALNRSKSVY